MKKITLTIFSFLTFFLSSTILPKQVISACSLIKPQPPLGATKIPYEGEIIIKTHIPGGIDLTKHVDIYLEYTTETKKSPLLRVKKISVEPHPRGDLYKLTYDSFSEAPIDSNTHLIIYRPELFGRENICKLFLRVTRTEKCEVIRPSLPITKGTSLETPLTLRSDLFASGSQYKAILQASPIEKVTTFASAFNNTITLKFEMWGPTYTTYREDLFLKITKNDPSGEEICQIVIPVVDNDEKIAGEEEDGGTWTRALIDPTCDTVPGSGERDGIDTALGCIPASDLNDFVRWFLRNVIFVASGIAFLLMAFGALQIITSAGSPDKMKAGSELITSALSGLLLIILSLFLLKLIGVDILRIPGFGK